MSLAPRDALRPVAHAQPTTPRLSRFIRENVEPILASRENRETVLTVDGRGADDDRIAVAPSDTGGSASPVHLPYQAIGRA